MIFIGRDRDAILGTERSILLSTLGASCLAALVILVLGFFTARGITSPLRQIIGLARKVSAGDLEARAEGRFTGEMAELKGALASMIEGVTARLSAHLGGQVQVLATGGFAEKLAPICPVIRDTRPQLLLEGLRRLWLGQR